MPIQESPNVVINDPQRAPHLLMLKFGDPKYFDDPRLEYRRLFSELLGRDRAAHADSGTRAVFAADKIAKVRDLALLPAWQLNEPKTRAKLAHYRASLAMLRRVDGDVPLVDRLDAELNQLLARPATSSRRARAITSAAGSNHSKPRTLAI
jgi:hypothetical protein